MSQILRAMRTQIMQIRRFNESRRNMRSHYETLRISPDASQQEVRLAFLKLSKEMHPDLSKKTNHSEFLKVHEAYKILCKKNTRQMYDVELRVGRGAHGRPFRVVYYQSESNPFENSNMNYPSDQPNFSTWNKKQIKRASLLAIACFCLIFSASGLTIIVLVLSKAVSHQQKYMEAETKRNEEAYDKIRSEVAKLSREEQIEAFEKRSAMNEEKSSIRYQS